MSFGSLLRQLRYSQNIGIKKLAANLDIDYAYLSRVENDKLRPSEKVIGKVSEYFKYDRDELMLLGEKIPEDIKKILQDNPKEALSYLREKFSGDDYKS